MIDPNTRIIDLTAGQLLDLLKGGIEAPAPQPPTLPKKNLVYGIGGIAQLFNCSMTTAHRIKSSGLIDKAIAQYGHTIAVDADLALQLMAESKSNKHNQ